MPLGSCGTRRRGPTGVAEDQSQIRHGSKANRKRPSLPPLRARVCRAMRSRRWPCPVMGWARWVFAGGVGRLHGRVSGDRYDVDRAALAARGTASRRGRSQGGEENHADDLKELKAAAKDIQKMFARAARSDRPVAAQPADLGVHDLGPSGIWDHPLIGTLARRLIWTFRRSEDQTGEDQPADDETAIDATWLDGRLVDVTGNAVEIDSHTATVSLWHPIGHEHDVIIAWAALLRGARDQASRSNRHTARSICSPTPSGTPGHIRIATRHTSCGNINSTRSVWHGAGETSCG